MDVIRRLGARVREAPGRTAVVVHFVLALVAVALVVLGIDHTLEQAPSTFNLDLEDTPAALFSTFLLAAAAVTAWLAAGRILDRPGHRRGLLALGAFLGFMAGDEALRFHEGLESATGVDWRLLYLPVVAVGAVAWLQVARAMRPHTAALALHAGGAAAWVASQAFTIGQWDGDVLVRPATVIPEEALEMAGSLLFLAALTTLFLRLPPLVDPDVPAVLLTWPPARVVAVLGLAVMGFVVVGWEPTRTSAETTWDLDEERNLAAVFSSLLLLAGGAAAILLARHVPDERGRLPGAWRFAGFGSFLAFMSVDELFVLHERVEQVLRVDWQLLYLPIAMAGGVFWLGVVEVLRRRDRLALRALVMGAACWVVSQVIELFQYDPGGKLVRPGSIVYEEALEMLGSIAFLAASLWFARTVRADAQG